MSHEQPASTARRRREREGKKRKANCIKPPRGVANSWDMGPQTYPTTPKGID
jgi:hypothetical protein